MLCTLYREQVTTVELNSVRIIPETEPCDKPTKKHGTFTDVGTWSLPKADS